MGKGGYLPKYNPKNQIKKKGSKTLHLATSTNYIKILYLAIETFKIVVLPSIAFTLIIYIPLFTEACICSVLLFMLCNNIVLPSKLNSETFAPVFKPLKCT